MKIAIVIVNYKTPDLVIQCLESLRSVDREHYDITAFIGDAASEDGSVDLISNHIRNAQIEWAQCFDIGKNGGFAYGNNFIVENYVLCDPGFEYVHFLNPDAYIHEGAVDALAEFLRSYPDAGVVGSRLENPDGSARSYGFRFPAPWREFFRGARLSVLDKLFPNAGLKIENLDHTAEVDWVTGASFMMPRQVIEHVGVMDDRYFLYFEEVDLMARVRKAGYEIWHVSQSRVVHLAGQSTGIGGGIGRPTRLPPYWHQSRYKFFRDHYGRANALAANLLFLFGDLIYRLHRTILLRPIQDPPHLIRDFFAFGFTLPPDRP